jgi:hypothetical protein
MTVGTKPSVTLKLLRFRTAITMTGTIVTASRSTLVMAKAAQRTSVSRLPTQS